MLEDVFPYFEVASLSIAIFSYKKYKDYSFYKYFTIFLLNIILFEILANTIFYDNNNDLFDVYTFFEFNLVALIYCHLIEGKRILKVIKILILIFNGIYFASFYFINLKQFIVILEGVVNSVFIVLFFRELLNSEKVLNYKKLLPFWVSVGFLLFYLTSIPFFTLLYSGLFNTRTMFPILYSLIIVFHLCFIYGLVTCKKMEE